MKYFVVILFSLATFAMGKSKCNTPKKPAANCYKGELAIKGICLHYVVSVTDATFDTTKLLSNWTDPQTGKVYHNVFTISNPCNFPDSIQEGDSFYFTLDSNTVDTCMRCMAFREVPAIQNPIAVKNKGCE